MRKIEYNSSNELCIVSVISSLYYVVYSYVRGYYYLLPLDTIRMIEYTKNGIYYLNNLEDIIPFALNPKSIDISEINAPIVIGLMVSNICNLNCSYCIANNAKSYSAKNALFDKDKIIELSDRIRETHVIGLMISGGEPFLNPELAFLIEMITDERFLCELDTNGTMFTDDLISIISDKFIIPRVSLDSLDPKVHNQLRGGFDRTIDTLHRLKEKNIEYRINTVLHGYNKESIFQLAEWIKDEGIKKWHVFKLQRLFAPEEIWLSDEETAEIVSELNDRYGNIIDILCKFSINNDGFASFMIDSEGNCFSTYKMDKILFGNVFEEPVTKIWQRLPNDYKFNHLNKYFWYVGKQA